MNPLDQIRAAEGWLELGNLSEAAKELHDLPPEAKSSVECLHVWVRIFSAQKAWDSVELTTDTLLKHDPDDPVALFHRAEALHKQKKSADAVLLIGQTKYGRTTAEGLYNLARYLCGNGQRDDAFHILGLAFGKDKKLRERALEDPELKQVWVKFHKG